MIVTHNVTIDLQDRGSIPKIDVMQDDQYTRELAISLMSGTEEWPVPEGAAVLIRYCKSDGVGGEYDTLPDGTAAWSASENVLTLSLAPQVLTVPGTVTLSAKLVRENRVLSIFSVHICVRQQMRGIYAESEPYYHVTGFLPGPVNAEVGQYLRVARVDEKGRVVAVEGADAVPGGPPDTVNPEPSGSGLISLTTWYGVSEDSGIPPEAWSDFFPEMSTEYPYLWIKINKYYSNGTAVADIGVIGYYTSIGSGDASGSGGGGISTTAIHLLMDILKAAVFTSNVTGKIEALKEALLADSFGSGETGGFGGTVDSGGSAADEITFAGGILTIISVGSDVSAANGVMTIL